MTTPDRDLSVDDIVHAVANGLPRDIAERASLLMSPEQREELRARLDDAELNARRAELAQRETAAELSRLRPNLAMPAAETAPDTVKLGVVDATVQILTGVQARAQYPDLFDQDDGTDYFDAGDATGNSHWEDFTPDLVLVVTNRDGRVVMASNASEWHLTACGYDIPEDGTR